MIKVGFIGAGNMGSALAKAAVKSADTKVYLYDMYEDKAKTLADEIGAEFKSNEYIAEMCDYIFLAVKPNIIKAAAEEISKTVAKRKNFAVVSMAAGVSIDAIEKAFSNSEIPIIRIMPNTPVGVGKGMTLWCKNGNDGNKRRILQSRPRYQPIRFGRKGSGRRRFFVYFGVWE